MKKLAIALCLCAGTAVAQPSFELVGRWRSVETSKGGIGAMYDFMEDGTARFSPGAIVPMPYQVVGDRLQTGSASDPVYRLEWSGADRLRLSFSGHGEDYTRLGTQPDAANPLLGEWTGRRSMDGQVVFVHWIFYPDSTAVLMIRFLTMEGRYEVRDGRLMATFGGQPRLTGSIALADGVLSIDRGGGRITRLKRY